jgi:hypothetical protein
MEDDISRARMDGIEMVKQSAGPSHNNRIQTELNPSGNPTSIFSKKMR